MMASSSRADSDGGGGVHLRLNLRAEEGFHGCNMFTGLFPPELEADYVRRSVVDNLLFGVMDQDRSDGLAQFLESELILQDKPNLLGKRIRSALHRFMGSNNSSSKNEFCRSVIRSCVQEVVQDMIRESVRDSLQGLCDKVQAKQKQEESQSKQLQSAMTRTQNSTVDLGGDLRRSRGSNRSSGTRNNATTSPDNDAIHPSPERRLTSIWKANRSSNLLYVDMEERVHSLRLSSPVSLPVPDDSPVLENRRTGPPIPIAPPQQDGPLLDSHDVSDTMKHKAGTHHSKDAEHYVVKHKAVKHHSKV